MGIEVLDTRGDLVRRCARGRRSGSKPSAVGALSARFNRATSVRDIFVVGGYTACRSIVHSSAHENIELKEDA